MVHGFVTPLESIIKIKTDHERAKAVPKSSKPFNLSPIIKLSDEDTKS